MLFDVVPDNFFTPLASPGKRVYWECIERLFAITSGQLSFGIERDVLTNELEYYFDSLMSADLPDNEEISAEEDGKTVRDRANIVIRRLEGWGWIYIETDKSYVQRVNFRDYAIKLMKSLEGISNEKHTEYQGYIYTIYSLSININKNPGQALLQIVDNTDLLITGLKSLNSNIKKYLDNLTKHTTVAELLKALLDDYYTNIVDKAYHRLLTSDNVSKFRPEIVEKLENCSRRTQFINAAAIEIAQIKELTEEEARENVLEMLHGVITAFRQMDDILEEINLKNTKYQRAAVNRARFLLADSEDIQGQLKDIICFINEKAQQQAQDYNAIYELEETDRLIKIFTWEFMDINSLYSPIDTKKEFISQQLLSDEIDQLERDERKRLLTEKLEKVLSPEKIDGYVLKMLAEENSIKASDTDLSDIESFIKLIYIRLYGSRKNMSYSIDPQEMIRKNGYIFRDFQITRKNPQP